MVFISCPSLSFSSGKNKTILLTPGDPRLEVFFPSYDPGSAVAVEHPLKYDLDLFYIGPFYHRVLPHVDKILFVDFDVEFR